MNLTFIKLIFFLCLLPTSTFSFSSEALHFSLPLLSASCGPSARPRNIEFDLSLDGATRRYMFDNTLIMTYDDKDIFSSSIYLSDKRLKKNIQSYPNALEKVLRLRGVSFNWKRNNYPEIGFVAQEVEKVEPRLVVTNPIGIKSVKYGNMVGIIVEALKDMKGLIVNLTLNSSAIEKDVKRIKDENILLKKNNEKLDLRIKRQEELLNSFINKK